MFELILSVKYNVSIPIVVEIIMNYSCIDEKIQSRNWRKVLKTFSKLREIYELFAQSHRNINSSYQLHGDIIGSCTFYWQNIILIYSA